MATSSNYTIDRDTLIRMGCEISGLATEGEPLQPEMAKVMARHLNLYIKFLTTKGLRLWKRERQSITLVASQSSYTLGQKYAGTTTATNVGNLEDSSANFVSKTAVGDTVNNTTDSTSTTISAITSTTVLDVADDIFASGENYEITTADESIPRPERILECNRKGTSDSNEVTVNPLSLEEYENLPNKSDTGTPVSYFYDPTLTNGRLYLWLTPDAQAVSDFTIEIVAAIQVNDMDSSTSEFDFPGQWLMPLVDFIAKRSTQIYGSARLGELDRLDRDLNNNIDDVVDYDQEPESVFFQPNLRQ